MRIFPILHSSIRFRRPFLAPALLVLAASMLVSSCANGIVAGSYTYTRLKLTVELYEGLANQQTRGLTKAMVSCDPEDVLMGGGFRTSTDGAAPIQIAASYPSDDVGHMAAPGASP